MSYRGNNAELYQCSIDTLVEMARSGDGDAFSELMGRHYGSIYRTAYSFLRRFEDAEDVVQDVSLTVFRKLHTFEGASAFSTWLTRIAINASLMRLRKIRRGRVFSIEDFGDSAADYFSPLADSKPSPEQVYAARELEDRLSQAVSRLPLPFKEAATDVIYEDLSMPQAAGKRGLSLPAVKSRCYRARKMLMLTLGRPECQLRSRPHENRRHLHS